MNKFREKIRQLMTLGLVLLVAMSQVLVFKTNVLAVEPTPSDAGKMIPTATIGSEILDTLPDEASISNVNDLFWIYYYAIPVDGEDYTFEIKLGLVLNDLGDYKNYNVKFIGEIQDDFEYVNDSLKFSGAEDTDEKDYSYIMNRNDFTVNIIVNQNQSEVSFKVKARDDEIDSLAGGEKVQLLSKLNCNCAGTDKDNIPVYGPLMSDLTMNEVTLPTKKNVVVKYYKDTISDALDDDGNYKYYLGSDETTFSNKKVGSIINKNEVVTSEEYRPYGYMDIYNVSGDFTGDVFTVSDNDEDNVIYVVYTAKEWSGYQIGYYYNDNGLLKVITGKSSFGFVGEKIPFNDDLADPDNDIDKYRPDGYTGQLIIEKSEYYNGYLQSEDNGARSRVIVIYNKPQEKPEGVVVNNELGLFEFYEYYTPVEGEEYTYDITVVASPLDMDDYLSITINLNGLIGDNFDFVEGSEIIDGVSKPNTIQDGDDGFKYNLTLEGYERKISFRIKAKEECVDQLNEGGIFPLIRTNMSMYGGYYLDAPNHPVYTANALFYKSLYLIIDKKEATEDPTKEESQESGTEDETETDSENVTDPETSEGEIAADTDVVLENPASEASLENKLATNEESEALAEVAADTTTTNDSNRTLAAIILLAVSSSVMLVVRKKR
ncbi:hypothetical protein [Lachnospira multipara]|uniref:Uncharacterized protein n=1 Tax=Lachnospira multipara TaxID=28051 RepID=A0A1H5T7U8_9FIRM|nr:hypothetical protein [Lachnospira multipara]SEF58171.1 hypothetical protein SAMN05216537_1041 [Lachnospira multipara]